MGTGLLLPRNDMRRAALSIMGVVIAGYCSSTAIAEDNQFINRYQQTNLVANNKIKYQAQLEDPHLINPWGVSLRPPGIGGHIWTSNNGDGTTSTFIGDVNELPIYQDALTLVNIPAPANSSAGIKSKPTGQVYNAASDLAGQTVEFFTSGLDQTGNITSGVGKFIFVTENGTISSWRLNTAASMLSSQVQIDKSQAISPPMYTGVALTTHSWTFDNNDPNTYRKGNHIYVADFRNRRIETYDNQWNDVTSDFAFARPAGVLSNFSPFNVQYLGDKIYVAYTRLDLYNEARTRPIRNLFGYVAEFNSDGTFSRLLNDNAVLNAPWGMAIAPDDFGALSNALLISNFGEGTIVGYNLTTGNFIDYLRGVDGQPLIIDNIWGLVFGNGVSLGTANHLYFTAGPEDRMDGLFGKLALVPEPGLITLMGLGSLILIRRPG
jgi:uncharacterized protein (TIGR03118 family)